ncbi:patatin-like phospholipase family protein [Elioraea sp.]|uniref:patatin-like phospholipase family protein n=1 Tax=Elioraea sp. TaxID=2185103 RepID=UPI003F70D3F9
MTRHRILSLDGGGAWALIQVRALIHLYGLNARGHDVLAQFDLAASNSGGSLVLGGLLMDLTLEELLALFLDQRKRESIFAAPGIWPGRYSATSKLAGLRAILGDWDRPLPEIGSRTGSRGRQLPHLLICAYDLPAQRGHLFRSDLNSPSAAFEPPPRRPSASLAEAIHASSNAPVLYFDDAARFGGGIYWDGAIAGWNCPAAIATVEALGYGWLAKEIALLALGTASVAGRERPLAPPSDDMGLKLRRIGIEIGYMLRAILKEPPNSAPLHAHIMLGGRLPTNPADPVEDGPVVRMSPNPNLTNVDPPHAALAALDMDAVADTDVALIVRLSDRWIANQVPNEPVRASRVGTPEIGHATLAGAVAAWQRLAPLR